MTEFGDEVFFRVGGILHEARMRECYGDTQLSSRKKWPETFKEFRGQRHEGQPWIDVAIAQVRALIKAGLIPSPALLAQRIEHEPSKFGVEGSNPSERTNPCPTCGFYVHPPRTRKPFEIEDDCTLSSQDGLK